MILGLVGKQASAIYFIALPYVRACNGEAVSSQ